MPTPPVPTPPLGPTLGPAGEPDPLDGLLPEQIKFYLNYDPMEGVTTASVLGGFFVLVCMMVLYKSRLKPWWKERCYIKLTQFI